MTRATSLTVMLFALGCSGGGSDATREGEESTGGEAIEADAADSAERAAPTRRMAAAQREFFVQFGPLWELTGVDRAVAVCAAAVELQYLAYAAGGACNASIEEPPEEDEEAYAAYYDRESLGQDMEIAFGNLIREGCGAGEQSDVETEPEYFDDENLEFFEAILGGVHSAFEDSVTCWHELHPE